MKSEFHSLDMFPTLRRACHIIVLIAVGCFSLANPAQAKPRTCRLVYPERPQDAPKTAYLFDGEKSRGVALPSMNLSDLMEMPDGQLTIAMTATEIAGPELLSPAAPQLIIPEEITDFYLIISADPDNEELPLKMELIDASDEKLKAGETLWCNFTQDRITAKLGSADITLDPMSQAVARDPVPASGYYNASFSYQEQGEGDLRPVTEQSWWHDANSKHLGLIVSSGGKLPKIFFFRDFRTPLENGVGEKIP